MQSIASDHHVKFRLVPTDGLVDLCIIVQDQGRPSQRAMQRFVRVSRPATMSCCSQIDTEVSSQANPGEEPDQFKAESKVNFQVDPGKKHSVKLTHSFWAMSTRPFKQQALCPTVPQHLG